MEPNFTLRAPTKETTKRLKNKRSSSFSIIEDNHSVHWISPSVFKRSNKKTTRPYLFTLAEVFKESSVVPTKPKAKRRRNEPSNAIKHKSKRVKKNEVKTAPKDFIILSRQSKAKGQSLRLSYILNNDPYNVLNVNPEATKSIIKNIYKKRAIELHPDKGGDKEEFIKLKTAYEILVDDK